MTRTRKTIEENGRKSSYKQEKEQGKLKVKKSRRCRTRQQEQEYDARRIRTQEMY